VDDAQHQNEDRLQWEPIIPETDGMAYDHDRLVQLILELRWRQQQGSPCEPVIAF
jgi:hypothetical protein